MLSSTAGWGLRGRQHYKHTPKAPVDCFIVVLTLLGRGKLSLNFTCINTHEKCNGECFLCDAMYVYMRARDNNEGNTRPIVHIGWHSSFLSTPRRVRGSSPSFRRRRVCSNSCESVCVCHPQPTSSRETSHCCCCCELEVCISTHSELCNGNFMQYGVNMQIVPMDGASTFSAGVFSTVLFWSPYVCSARWKILMRKEAHEHGSWHVSYACLPDFFLYICKPRSTPLGRHPQHVKHTCIFVLLDGDQNPHMIVVHRAVPCSYSLSCPPTAQQ